MPGIVFDGLDRPLSPTYTQKRNQRYRYYVTRAVSPGQKSEPGWRIPANDLEEIVIGKLSNFLEDRSALQSVALNESPEQLEKLFETATRASQDLNNPDAHKRRELLLEWLHKVVAEEKQVVLAINLKSIFPDLKLGNDINQTKELRVAASIVRTGKQTKLAIPPSSNISITNRDPSPIKLVTKAWQARSAVEGSKRNLKAIAKSEGYEADYFARLVRLGYLAPDIITAIIDGKQPPTLTRQKLARMPKVPVSWREQRELLGFEPS